MSTPTVPLPPPSTFDEITKDKDTPTYNWIKDIEIVGIKKKVRVEFSLLYKNYDDNGILRVGGTLLIWVYNEQVGDLLVERNLLAESATRLLQWVKKDFHKACVDHDAPAKSLPHKTMRYDYKQIS